MSDTNLAPGVTCWHLDPRPGVDDRPVPPVKFERADKSQMDEAIEDWMKNGGGIEAIRLAMSQDNEFHVIEDLGSIRHAVRRWYGHWREGEIQNMHERLKRGSRR